jgi:hypothetical protein
MKLCLFQPRNIVLAIILPAKSNPTSYQPRYLEKERLSGRKCQFLKLLAIANAGWLSSFWNNVMKEVEWLHLGQNLQPGTPGNHHTKSIYDDRV